MGEIKAFRARISILGARETFVTWLPGSAQVKRKTRATRNPKQRKRPEISMARWWVIYILVEKSSLSCFWKSNFKSSRGSQASCPPDVPAEAWERRGFIPDKSTRDFIPDSLTHVGVASKDPVLGEVLGLEEDLLKDGRTQWLELWSVALSYTNDLFKFFLDLWSKCMPEGRRAPPYNIWKRLSSKFDLGALCILEGLWAGAKAMSPRSPGIIFLRCSLRYD